MIKYYLPFNQSHENNRCHWLIWLGYFLRRHILIWCNIKHDELNIERISQGEMKQGLRMKKFQEIAQEHGLKFFEKTI